LKEQEISQRRNSVAALDLRRRRQVCSVSHRLRLRVRIAAIHRSGFGNLWGGSGGRCAGLGLRREFCATGTHGGL